MHSSILLLTLCFSVMSPAVSAAFELREGQVQIALRAEVAVHGPEVRLGDIAILHTHDLPTIQRLAALPLGRASRVGAEVVVRRDVIARWVRSQLGTGRQQVLWGGASETRVRQLAQELPAARLEQAGKAALLGWLAQRTTRHSVHALAVPSDLKLPSGRLAIEVRPFAENAEVARRMTVWLDVQVEGRFVRAVPVSFAVEAYRDAWVAPAGIAKGVALAPSMVERREVKITAQSTGAWMPVERSRSSEIPAGWRTIKVLAEGEPITPRNAAPAPLIARGEWLLLQLKSGVVELERPAQAMQDGELGQILQVRPSGSATPLGARVIAPGRVQAVL